MEQTAVLTPRQQKLLQVLSDSPFITDSFYLGGGTALAEFYLHHRYSEDLDFFSEREVDQQEVNALLKSIQKKVGFQKFDFQSSFNRNLFFLHFENDAIKTEFTYYPFSRIQEGLKKIFLKNKIWPK